ncbi:MAG: DUF4089 domain-containing protein [Microcystis aeruginosa Ma_QC_C_20070703_M131]|jgi:hypothetical protein|uniref:DUF4089 domain-containing protein n=1 Tax=Microcystis aeruginosa Ma_QC_C_20070703_M131 TaxID=2486263 RepID=A0A551XYG9_MICAE|nr:MAG: DUF4089 domain-containing protein [Microcystis aeruginosa Ma_QC_C_20070703_M131]
MNNPEEYVIIMAKILDLAIPDRYLNSVVENWQRLQEIASLVTDLVAYRGDPPAVPPLPLPLI